MEQITHTAGLLSVREDGEANTYALIDDTDRWLLALLHNGVQATERQRVNVRRLAAAWNACDGIGTGEIEALGAGALTKARRQIDAMSNALRVAVQVFDRIAQGADYGAVCEETGCMALASQALLDAPTDDPRAELEAIRAAVRAHDDRMDDKANDGANAQPPNGDDYNEIFGFVMRGAPAPWHLFYVEAADDDGGHGFIVSAQSESQDKARELAESSVAIEGSPGSAAPMDIEHTGYLGIVDRDMFEVVGLLAD